ncbi:MAG TPA: DUF1849 family protein [Alphaproteobacteria bacterium]|nr:DUF1849 family protein [Alphaproteobacteria bacterium]HOO50104.1 DUF1849 family protein [Alphaproteobacteria bacterium]
MIRSIAGSSNFGAFGAALMCGVAVLLCSGASAYAAASVSADAKLPEQSRLQLAPHRAVYEIKTKTIRRGSAVIGLEGALVYDFKVGCTGWITDHRFNMVYEYSSANPVQVDSKFSSFESFDGSSMSFSSTRSRDGEVYETLRGLADMTSKKSVHYSLPADGEDDILLKAGTLFPVAHTSYLLKQARDGKRVVHAVVFDGSDQSGPVEMNAILGRKIAAKNDAAEKYSSSLKSDMKGPIDAQLLAAPGWTIHMAVFPSNEKESLADYELSMDVLENGIVREMNVDYHDFSIVQRLIALEKRQPESCKD